MAILNFYISKKDATLLFSLKKFLCKKQLILRPHACLPGVLLPLEQYSKVQMQNQMFYVQNYMFFLEKMQI